MDTVWAEQVDGASASRIVDERDSVEMIRYLALIFFVVSSSKSSEHYQLHKRKKERSELARVNVSVQVVLLCAWEILMEGAGHRA